MIKKRIFSPEHRRKLSLARLGEKCPTWKGDYVGINALHGWVRSRLSRPELCEICNIKPSYDLANITGIYNRDFENWKYLCRSCHIRSDGRINNLKKGGAHLLRDPATGRYYKGGPVD